MNRKALWIVAIVLVLAVAVVFAACDAQIDDGKIDVDKEALEALPFTVEVTGLEGVNGTGKVSALDSTAYAAALAAVKEVYPVADKAVVYAVDIKIVDADGKEIKVGKPVTVALTMKGDDRFVYDSEVFHVHDGKATQMAIAIDGKTASFTVDTFSPFVLVPRHVHSYGDWTEAYAPTCTEKGMNVRTCACGARETQDVDPRHTVDHHAAVEATCTEAGNVEYFTCSVCGKYFLDAECTQEITLAATVVPATGHVDKNKDNTCDLCGADLCEHALEHVAAVAVTCNEDGNIEYYRCAKCGKYFSDAAGTNEITLNATLILHMGHVDADEDEICDKCGESLHVHAYGEWFMYSEPDCLNVGLEKRECACGAYETREFGTVLGHIDANGDEICDRCGTSLHVHAYGEWFVYSEPDCLNVGLEKRECACGAIETRTVGEALGHNAKHVDAAAESCTEDGNIEYYYCTRCEKCFADAECTQEITLASTVLEATGHVDVNEDDRCDACGAYLGEPKIVMPDDVDVVGMNGSVLTADWQEMSVEDAADAWAIVHGKYDFDEAATTYAADISVQGAQPGTVARVSITLDEPELSLDSYAVYHVHGEDVEMIIPDVSGNSLVFTVSSFSPFIVGPKHQHQPSPLIVVTPATCTEDGEGYIECIKCHDKLETQVIKANGHVDDNEDGTCDVCGVTIPAKPEDYVAGKVFKFDHAEGEGVNNATYAEAYADATLTFFEGNYMEYHVFNGVRGGNVAAANIVLCGTYTMQAVDGGYEIAMSVTKRYYDDEETMIPIAKYIFNYNEAAATVSVADYPATLYYKADAEAEPALYVAPPLADNWDGAVITAAFKAVGATEDYTFPKLDNVLTMTKGNVQENGLVTVTIVMSSKMQGTQAATQYKDYLEFIYYDYSWTNVYGNPETRVNTDDNQFWFVMSVGNIDVYAALTVTIGRFYPAYPDAGIVNYLTDAGITDSIPEFKTPWAMKYHFDTEGYSPAIACIWAELRYEDGVEQHDTDVAADFVALLKSQEYGYTEKEINDVTYLCSPNKQMLLRVSTGKVGNTVAVRIYDYSIIYPAEAIAAYLEGTSDPFIDIDDDSVFGYALYTNEADNPTALRLVGKFPSSVNAHLFVSGLMTTYTEAGYKWGGYATHFGNEEDETNYYHAWISPNQEIAIMFSSFNNGEHLFGTFSYYSISIVNMTKIDAANKAFMTSLSAAGHSTTVERGAKYTFNGGIAYLYTNAQTGLEGGGAYTTDLFLVDVGTLDTSTPGERTFRISLKRNADIYVDVPITVLGLTGISATANTQVIDGRYVYTSTLYTQASYYTITRYYSDGHTDTVKGTDSSIAFGDIDGSKAQQDLTISCTVDGVTVSTTVAIGLFKSFNYACTNDWDITNDDATFAALVKGGTYGDIGCWVTVNCNFNAREKTIIGMVYVDATSIQFARVSPDLYDELFGSLFIDPENGDIWNKSDVITLQDGPSNGNFAFLG